MAMKISFNYPHITGKELEYIKDVFESRHLCGDGKYSQLCHGWLEEKIGCERALLTPSGTAALEMAALLLDIKEGDEVIMPSFTFVSTANAFVLRGAKIVFVDITRDTCNIDAGEIEKAITSMTRAVVPVHYAGIACDMPAIMKICDERDIAVVEDAAHAILSNHNGKALGSFGSLAAFSFHETKNLVAGEAGALIINDARMVERAEIIREKGTNRSQFFRGQIDKYTWQDLGSSFLPSELQAAFLWAQMEEAGFINARRQATWEMYHQALKPLEENGLLRRPTISPGGMQNGHIYYVLTNTAEERDELMHYLVREEIGAVFHYIPLHDAPGAAKHSRVCGNLDNTAYVSSRLLRLPLSVSLSQEQVQFVVDSIAAFYQSRIRKGQLQQAAL